MLTAQGGAGPAKSKIIERVLTTVLTPGTLMGDFVVEENATYIMSIKVYSGCQHSLTHPDRRMCAPWSMVFASVTQVSRWQRVSL